MFTTTEAHYRLYSRQMNQYKIPSNPVAPNIVCITKCDVQNAKCHTNTAKPHFTFLHFVFSAVLHTFLSRSHTHKNNASRILHIPGCYAVFRWFHKNVKLHFDCITALMQPRFKFQSSADNNGYFSVMPKGTYSIPN
jgi:hypothetical protein